MARPFSIPDLKKGEVYGCWTVKREWYPKHAQRRYVVTAGCCGREVVKLLRDILRAVEACTRCCKNRGRHDYAAARAGREAQS